MTDRAGRSASRSSSAAVLADSFRVLFGVKPDNAYVDLGDELDARFGYGHFRTPVSNIRLLADRGPVALDHGDRHPAQDPRRRLLLRRRATGGVRVDFREPVPGLRIFRTPALYVTVEDPEGFAAALRSAASPARTHGVPTDRAAARAASIAATMPQFDYIIVGGGSAGSVLANRLTEDPHTRVLVLEAGRSDWRIDPFIHMPAALTFPIGSRFYDWQYESEPEPFMHGRRIYHARGKVLGGSSSINGQIFQRGNPLDYERWGADPGMETWDFAHCLPYFKKMETAVAVASPTIRGAATTAHWSWSGVRPRARCSEPSSPPPRRPATRSPTT